MCLPACLCVSLCSLSGLVRSALSIWLSAPCFRHCLSAVVPALRRFYFALFELLLRLFPVFRVQGFSCLSIPRVAILSFCRVRPTADTVIAKRIALLSVIALRIALLSITKPLDTAYLAGPLLFLFISFPLFLGG